MSDAVTPRGRAKTRRLGRRRVIGAAVCLVMGLLASVAGMKSGWRHFGFEGSHIAIVCGRGALAVAVQAEGQLGGRGWIAGPPLGLFSWNGVIQDTRAAGWFRFDLCVAGILGPPNHPKPGWGLFISLWFLAAVFLLTAITLALSARRSARRARAGLCPTPTCHYDLRGLPPSAPCPECGKVRR